jgi:hypothetical protein
VSSRFPTKNFPALEAQDLVREALINHAVFKFSVIELEKRPPSRPAAEIVVNAFRNGDAPPWLAAVLLGACRDKVGYNTVREMLLSAPRIRAEGYAGVALAKIAGHDSLDDLINIMSNATDRHICEGAAFGLNSLGLPESAQALRKAALSGKMRPSTAAWMLARSFPNEGEVLELLRSPDQKSIRLATEIIETGLLDAGSNPSQAQLPGFVAKPSLSLLKALKNVLTNPKFSMRPKKRATFRAWLDKNLRQPSGNF